MKNSFKKILIAFLIVGLNWAGLSAVGNTAAYYNDPETSTENTLKAGVIDFTLTDNGFDPIEPSISMGPGDITRKIIDVVPDALSNPLQYYASSTNFSGDEDFCAGLNVDLKFDDGTKYGGDTFYSASLSGLNTSATATTSLDSWMYEFGAGTQNFQNKTCEFDIDYNGWQTRHDYPTYEQGGFSDTEKVENKISSWGFRINKVYYDVAPDRGVEGDNEWVEIYNQTNVLLDISGWEICDNQSCDVLPTTDPIPAFGYGVITASTTTWEFWNIPSDIKKIVLPDGNIGNRLGNNEDMLVLRRPDGVIVDQMNWGVPSTGWNNYNDDVWNPGVTDTDEGNTLARVPNGYDTDQPSDWTELTPPEVDLIYPDEAGDYTWYWNQDYNIQWTAINHNGDDADLSIDISYIRDIDQNGEIGNGDIEYPIVSNTANDGLYNWTVPSGFIGYIWVKLIATGPENPMLNDVAISGDIYDPIPVFVDNTTDTAMLEFLDEGDGELVDGDEMPFENEKQTTEEQTDEEFIVGDDTSEDDAIEINEKVDSSETEDTTEGVSEDNLLEDDDAILVETEEDNAQDGDVSSEEELTEEGQENNEADESSNDETNENTDENQANDDTSSDEEELDETIDKVVEVVSDGVDAVNEFVNGESDDVKDGDEQTDEVTTEETTEVIEGGEGDVIENTDENTKSTEDAQVVTEDSDDVESSEVFEEDASAQNNDSSEDDEDVQTEDVAVREDVAVEDTTQDDSQSNDVSESDDSSDNENTDSQDDNEPQVI